MPCSLASVQVQPGDYASKVADALRLPIERLLQQNVERIPDLGAWLKPGQRLQACGASELRACLYARASKKAGVCERVCVHACVRASRHQTKAMHTARFKAIALRISKLGVLPCRCARQGI